MSVYFKVCQIPLCIPQNLASLFGRPIPYLNFENQSLNQMGENYIEDLHLGCGTFGMLAKLGRVIQWQVFFAFNRLLVIVQRRYRGSMFTIY